MTTLVLGGAGFLGRHVAAALAARGHTVVIGSRRPRRAARRLPPALHACERREAHLERLTSPEAWRPLLAGIDTVVNAVGILRERGAETYERVHHLAPGALAAACARRAIRLIHISALGLHGGARSGFLRSKLAGERALAACGTNYSIVRPSLLDGDDGYGARWFRRVARWPVHFVPADAHGRIAALDVRDFGEAVAVLCENHGAREVELGGSVLRTAGEYLAALRPAHLAPAVRIAVPAWIARVASHLCDLVHFSPFSYGHLELMRRDNAPRYNLLPTLLGRAPTPVGSVRPTSAACRAAAGRALSAGP
ncbi:MAG TPA: NAD(P)H-binding protein [Burkholderiales bacterium]|nr:NAD(P)H-binding protein [Burkholderiales bacterium]